MPTPVKKEFQYGAHAVTLETGEIARQATGAVMTRMGDTVVLATVVADKKAAEGRDFFPLTVDYQEKTYAAGKIPGGFLKREGRPSEHETLTSRLIDRPVRPLFPEGFTNEVQIIATVLSMDPDVSPDIVAMIGVSAALSIAGLPFNGPIGAARVGYIDGEYVLNPSSAKVKESDLDLVVAGTENAVLMVESEAKLLSEEVMLGAVMFGHEQQQVVIQAIKEFAAEVGTEPMAWTPPEPNVELEKAVAELGEAAFKEAYTIREKQPRYNRLGEIRSEIIEKLAGEEGPYTEEEVRGAIEKLEKKVVRGKILNGEPRIDGRDTRTVRPITVKVGVLPRTHGSALFTRGETQALVTATLGTEREAQIIDAAVQLPALLRGRNRPRRQPQAPRNRSRPPGQARRARRHAQPRGIPVHHPRGLRDHRVQRLQLHGLRVRHQPRPDGCRRAPQGPGGRYCHGSHQGRRQVRRAHRHPR